MGKYTDRPYEVGKGKPPRAHQWRKGQSGNPRGPRRKRNEADATSQEILAEIANMPIETVDKRGRIKTIPMKKAMLMELARDGLKGTPAQRRQVIALLQACGFFDMTPPISQQSIAEQNEERNRALDALARFAEEEEERERVLYQRLSGRPRDA